MPSVAHPFLPGCGRYHLEQLNETTFSLSPRRIPVKRKTPTVKRDVDLDMESCQDYISDEDSGWSEVSDNSSTDSECTDVEASSIALDLDRFDTVYDAIRGLADGLYNIDLRRLSRGTTSEDASGVLLEGGWEKFQDLAHLRRTWPLARLTIPLEGLSKQIDRLLEGSGHKSGPRGSQKFFKWLRTLLGV